MKTKHDVVLVPINEVRPYENNPRINDDAVDKVKNSIKEFGFTSPIILDANNVIICGHTRLKAAKELKMSKVPCIIKDDLTPQQVKAYRLADNKVGEIAGWNFELLDQELADILDFDMSDFGFHIDNILEDSLDEPIDTNNGRGSLAERFLFAPTSVLNTMRGEWQQRKKKWYDLGLSKGEGREEMVSAGSLAGTIPGYYTYKAKAERVLVGN